MLNKKSVKIVSFIMLVFVLLGTLSNTVFAEVTVPEANEFNPTTELSNTINNILGVIKYAGIVIAVIITMYIGIKYITASPEGKAEVKKTLGFFVGGIVLLLSASTIIGVLQTTLS
ncbi:MAG: hypothetical protein E7313_04035 [Clostridiales bacterium]|nr:hypothetical protein [Clostridiales bacterium]